MTVKQCYIENFGTLHDQTFDFTDGINVIMEDNGWGKSTLAVFIKCMFYDMEYSNKKKVIPENKKYEPWNGGRYGGFMIFSAGGREYKVIRYFGRKAADRVFELYDLATNRLCDDYSTNLGGELFGIDRDSFERSIFIKLDSARRDPSLSDSVSAKLGNLVDNTDDINNYETAVNYLDKLASSIIQKRGSGGLLGKIENEIRDVTYELEECSNAERQIDSLNDKIDEQKRLLESLTEAENKLKLAAENSALFEKKERYEKLTAKAAALRSRQAELKEFFKNGAPDDSELDAHTKDAESLAVFRAEKEKIGQIEDKKNQLARTEEFFAGGVPARDELDRLQNDIIEYNKAKERLAAEKPSDRDMARRREITGKYGGSPPTVQQADSLAAISDRIALINSEISEKNVRLSGLYAAKRESDSAKPNIWLTVILAVVAVIGIAAAVVSNGIIYIVSGAVVAVGAIIGMCAMFIVKKSKGGADGITEISEAEQEKEELIKERGELQNRCAAALNGMGFGNDVTNLAAVLTELRTDIKDFDDIEYKISRYEAEKSGGKAREYQHILDEFFGKYSFADETEDYSKKLSYITRNLEKYENLKREVAEYDRAAAAEADTERRLVPFLSKYPAGGEYSALLREIRDKLRFLREAEDNLKSAEDEIGEFESKNDIEALRYAKKPEMSEEALNREQKICREGISARTGELARLEQEVSRLSETADKRQDLESRLISLGEKKTELSDKHDILRDTISCLEKAKDNMMSKYMSDMTAAFGEYIRMLDPENERIILTADLDTKILSGGQQWDSGYHSRGYADLVNICTRLALVDVMYKNEKPFLILDDPFVNLDDKKVKRALAFIKEISAEKQIFYFTCHTSRGAPA